jgi:2-polyprenyl-3-methyl-5-hydroxy-6-metoxy-1,4-benzoquinol methylase
MIDQQRETLAFFESHAKAWQTKAIDALVYNVIDGRNAAALAVAAKINARCLLDVGCGTGQLVNEAAVKGIQSLGIDFASEMIAICETNKISPKATFKVVSFFDLETLETPFDLVSAQGFIEYIPERAMESFFERAFAMLSPGGALVVGSRNRLFNAHSMNNYTDIEERLGTLPRLMQECAALHLSTSQEGAISGLTKLARIDPQPEGHPDTGIGVSIRYQYSPAELIGRLQKHGFKIETIFPIHYHGLPLKYAAEHPDLHNAIAKAVELRSPEDQRLVPLCSSFVLHARRQ